LVASPRGDGRGFDVLDAFSRIVRLGEGMGDPDAPMVLSDAAMERAVKALKVCAGKMRQHDVARARCVATEACRRAVNRDDFLDRVRVETGISLEVISRHREGELAVSGCAPLISDDADHVVVFDIGGGSTEIVLVDLTGEAPRHLGSHSIPRGVVSMAEKFGRDRFDRETYAAMIDHVVELLGDFEARHGLNKAIGAGARVQMIGTSGTVTTLAGVDMGLARYDRAVVDGTTLSFETIERVSRDLAAGDLKSRADRPCVGHARADLVVGGCAVLEALCRAWPVGAVTVADRGVREGLLYELIASSGPGGLVSIDDATCSSH
jgi:exopolyphosphatase/guanosine-5'-triphosphate,3'-diphosphate pyrophosphatase